MSIESIVKKLQESKHPQYYVIDNTGEVPEKYAVYSKEGAEDKVAELISLGSNPEDIECDLLNESKDQEDTAQELLPAINDKLMEFMTDPSAGFSKEEAKEYSRVDIRLEGTDTIIVEVGAELSYDALMELCDALNPIVSYYDKDAYFEPVQSGIIEAYVTIKSEKSVRESVKPTLEDIKNSSCGESIMDDRAYITIDGQTYTHLNKGKWEHDTTSTHAIGEIYNDNEIYQKALRANYAVLVDESKNIDEGKDESDWEYWEMPKDYKGPWTHDNYSKKYSNDIIGFIYPPYSGRFSTMQHKDFVAELYDDKESVNIIEKDGFSSLENAKKWLDNQASQNLATVTDSKEIDESSGPVRSITFRGKSYPVKTPREIEGELAGYGNEMGLEHIATTTKKINGEDVKFEIYDSGVGNLGHTKSCALIAPTDDHKEFTEDIIWDEIHPAISQALVDLLGEGLDDASYVHNDRQLKGQGFIYIEKKRDTDRTWKKIEDTLESSLAEHGFKNAYRMLDIEKREELTIPHSPFIAYHIEFKAEED